MAAPLDFEFEDPLDGLPVPSKRRKKVIGLDDLLTDFYKEEGKRVQAAASKRRKNPRKGDSDVEDNAREVTVSNALDKYQKQMKEMGCEEEVAQWGLSAFGVQKRMPSVVPPEPSSCALLLSLNSDKLHSLLQFGKDEELLFIEGLLAHGWLSMLIFVGSQVDEVIAKWTFNLCMYGLKEELRSSAYQFWFEILSAKDKDKGRLFKINWLPKYSELKVALDSYSFIFFSSDLEPAIASSSCVGPPCNIRMWIKFVSACCKARSKWPIFSSLEAEELTQIIIRLLLDRRLEGLSMLLHECLSSVINYFTNEEWSISCNKVAKSIASRLPKDLNCLQAVECICGVDLRSKHFRSEVAYQILGSFQDNEAPNEEQILSFLISIDLKGQCCDLFKVYMYLVLAENWLLSDSTIENKPVIGQMWNFYLRNCSCLIASTDLRSYASKVRNRAAYLLQGTVNR
ncbi:hypothetical protein MLD38_009578 [Melastoma candidum]|uniref:Uncharacterized protein n=1 Tax=Melastoma candidum TaxID=119954 RepID=A0ACB9S2C3_9MYRT|nr:hypothetical protein MLD38_009578 [Melastoma candidum]